MSACRAGDLQLIACAALQIEPARLDFSLGGYSGKPHHCAIFAAGTGLAHCPSQGRIESIRPVASITDKVLLTKGDPMGKYFLAWLLGVPAGLLVIIYLVMHM